MIHPILVTVSFGSLFATGIALDEKTIVPVGTFGCVGALLWWLATKLQKIDDRLTAMEKTAGESACPVYERITARNVKDNQCSTCKNSVEEVEPIKML